MDLSPEERIKIYEEEKERIEAEQRKETTVTDSTTGLKPNVAGLLCYLAGWITGIIFVVIEQKNHFVRFHAMQSIVVFGALTIASALLTWIPYVGGFFGAVIGILGFVLWVVLMVKAYQGELYKVPIAGDIAGGILPTRDKAADIPSSKSPAIQTDSPISAIRDAKISTHRMDNYFTESRALRLTASSFAIAWSIALLIFFSFFHNYIAYYHSAIVNGATTWTKTPILTDDYFTWLPVLITTLALSIAGHVILIVHDRYWLRQTILIILNVIGIVTIATLLDIFPFNFDVIPSSTWADVVPIIITIVLVCVAVGLGIGTLVMLIKFVVNLMKETSA